MKTFSLLAAVLLAGATAAVADPLTYSFNFDSATGSPALASQFDTGAVSFHNAMWAASKDADGIDIAGTEHWQIDTVSDASFPVTVENPLDYDRGAAPSGDFALQALWQPVILSFDQTLDLTNFSVTLDNDTYGLSNVTIDFVSGATIVGQITIDQTTPGFTATLASISGVTGIVLASGAFYDNLSFTATASAVPEPSTYAALIGAAGLGWGVWRRRRQAAA